MRLPGESWSWQRHAQEHRLHHCGHFRTLRRVIVMAPGAFDEGSEGSNDSTQCDAKMFEAFESAARDCGHDLTGGWPLLGLSGPNARADLRWSPAEASAVISWLREAAALETAKKQLEMIFAKGAPKIKSDGPL